MKHFLVRDSITIERVWWAIQADDAEAAIDLVSDGDIEPDHEEQIDNTPYEAEEVTPAEVAAWHRAADPHCTCNDCIEYHRRQLGDGQ